MSWLLAHMYASICLLTPESHPGWAGQATTNTLCIGGDMRHAVDTASLPIRGGENELINNSIRVERERE